MKNSGICLVIVTMLLGRVYGGEPTVRVAKLVNESKAREYIGRSRLLDEKPLVDDDIAETMAYIKQHPNFHSYYLLFAVRMYFPNHYKEISAEVKAKVLCSALKNIKFLNDWGWITPSRSFDAESAEALLELGKSAIKELAPLLEDTNNAPIAGSGGTTSSFYKYMRRDFAYRYISVILKQEAGSMPILMCEHKNIKMLIEKLKNDLK